MYEIPCRFLYFPIHIKGNIRTSHLQSFWSMSLWSQYISISKYTHKSPLDLLVNFFMISIHIEEEIYGQCTNGHPCAFLYDFNTYTIINIHLSHHTSIIQNTYISHLWIYLTISLWFQYTHIYIIYIYIYKRTYTNNSLLDLLVYFLVISMRMYS